MLDIDVRAIHTEQELLTEIGTELFRKYMLHKELINRLPRNEIGGHPQGLSLNPHSQIAITFQQIEF